MIYLDSCALVKLIRQEKESAALQAWLDERPDTEHVTSELARAEVLRVVRRSNHTARGVVIDTAVFERELAEANELLDNINFIVLDAEILDQAGSSEVPSLKTLDAIHLTSAMQLKTAITEFVTYDRGLRRVAEQAMIRVTAPS